MAVDTAPAHSPTTTRSSSDLARWDLSDVLRPSSGPHFARDRKMSLDFNPSAQNQSSPVLYGQPELDQAFNSLQRSDNVGPSHSHHLNFRPTAMTM